ncbi:MAG: small-conductance mechanosensitive channel, partial [Bacteroidota bacterium]
SKVVSSIIAKVLTKIGLDKLADKLNETETFTENHISVKPVGIIKNFIYWVLMLIFILSAAETIGLNIVTEQVGALIAYLPKLFTAFIILAIGFYIADAIKGMIARSAKTFGISAWRAMSNGVFYILLIAIIITSLNQAGINTDIITSNIYIILGGVFLAFAIAYGFAARNVLSSILTSFYTRGNFEVGQVISIDGFKGQIVKMTNVSLTLFTGKEYVVFPLSRLINDKVIIHQEKLDFNNFLEE